MDHTEQLKNYLKDQMAAGFSPDELRGHLLQAGWQADMIEAGFEALRRETEQQQVPAVQNADPYSAQDQWQQYDIQAALPAADGRKRGKLKTGWMLFRQSFKVLRGNPYLLRYLAMTALWVFVITGAFIALYFMLDRNKPTTYSYENDFATTSFGWVVLFCNYVLVYFAIYYYAAALTANVLDLFRGVRRPYQEYIAVARSKFFKLFMFSLISSTVGIILEYIVERFKLVGLLVSWLLGALWSFGTLFVVPILVNSDVSAPTAIKQSIMFFKKTWGENITAKVTVNVPLFLIQFAALAIFLIGLIPLAATGAPIWIFYAYSIMYIIVMLGLAIVGSFANSLVNIALYYYASSGQVPPAFSAELLNSVFIQKRPNKILQKLRGK